MLHLFKFAAANGRAFSTEASRGVGFIGLGQMGSRMAPHIITNGKSLSIFDLFTPAVQELVAKGASPCSSPANVTAASSVVVTMLPSSPHVREVYLGKNGILEALKNKSDAKDTLLIDTSTIDPAVSREVAKIIKEEVGASFVDAPVSGGVGGAAAGTLTFMVGGSVAEFERAKPILAMMGKNIVHCGDVGTGQVAKICNNMVLGITMTAVSEAMLLGSNLGIDPKVLAGIFNTSSARCWSSDTYNPFPGVMPNVPASNGYAGGFGSALMLKDLGLAVDAARASGSSVPLGGLTQQLYQLAVRQGNGKKDFSSILEILRGIEGNKQ